MNASPAMATTMNRTMTQNTSVAVKLWARLASALVVLLMDVFVRPNRSLHEMRDKPCLVAAGSRLRSSGTAPTPTKEKRHLIAFAVVVLILPLS